MEQRSPAELSSMAPSVCMRAHGGSLWLTEANDGSRWLNVAQCGSLWLTVAHGGSLSLIVAHGGSLWLTVAHDGSCQQFTEGFSWRKAICRVFISGANTSLYSLNNQSQLVKAAKFVCYGSTLVCACTDHRI